MDLVAKELGVEQKIVDTPFETIKTGADLNAGKCDVAAAGMTITDERKQSLDFSVPYFDATQALLAKKGSGITSLDSAKGKKVGSQSATTGEDYVKAAKIDPVSFETSDAELNGLKSGQVDVIIQDLPVVSEWLKDKANADYEVVANLDTGEQYGFAVKKDGNDDLLKTIDDVITAAKQDGRYDDAVREVDRRGSRRLTGRLTARRSRLPAAPSPTSAERSSMSTPSATTPATSAALPPTAPTSRLTRRQRRRLSLGVQYALFVAVVAALAALADWSSLRANFARGDLAREMFPDVLTVALKNTVVYTLTGFGAGLLLGVVLALMRLSSVPPYRWLAMAYIEVFRGLPALLIFIFVGVGVPLAFPGTQIPGGTVGKVALALALVSAAYMAETVRAGISAVPKGQREAARSLGMSGSRAMISVVIPQAFRIIVPPLTNELVLLFKDSSLVLFLGVQLGERELTKFGRDLASTKANITPILVAGLCYLMITVPLSYLARRLEARNAKATA